MHKSKYNYFFIFCLFLFCLIKNNVYSAEIIIHDDRPLIRHNNLPVHDSKPVTSSDGSDTGMSTEVIYNIKNTTGKYLEGNCNGGYHLSSRKYNNVVEDQRFVVTQEDSLPGFYRISLAKSNKKYVEAYCNNSHRVKMRAYHDSSPDQQWGFFKEGDGYIRIYNPMFLEINCSSGDGCYSCSMRKYDNNSKEQMFSIESAGDNNLPVYDSKPVTSSDGSDTGLFTKVIYNIKNMSKGKYLEGNCNGGYHLSDRKYNDKSGDQKFVITQEDSLPGFYRISLAKSNKKYVEAYCDNSHRVKMRAYHNSSPGQQWGFLKEEDGSIRIYNPMFLEINCSSGDGCYSCSMREYDNSPQDQKFSFIPVR